MLRQGRLGLGQRGRLVGLVMAGRLGLGGGEAVRIEVEGGGGGFRLREQVGGRLGLGLVGDGAGRRGLRERLGAVCSVGVWVRRGRRRGRRWVRVFVWVGDAKASQSAQGADVVHGSAQWSLA